MKRHSEADIETVTVIGPKGCKTETFTDMRAATRETNRRRALPMKRHIGFDPSKASTGYAYQNSRGAWVVGICKPEDTNELQDIVFQAMDSGVTNAAIETWKWQKYRSATAPLVEAQTRVLVACEDMWGKECCQLIDVNEWRKGFKISGNRAHCKYEALIEAVRRGVPVPSVTALRALHHVSEAIAYGMQGDIAEAALIAIYADATYKELTVKGGTGRKRK